MKYIDTLLQLTHAYKLSNVLFVAAEMKILNYLRKPCTVADVAGQLSLNPLALQIVLDLLASQGIVHKSADQHYYLDEEGTKLLTDESDQSVLPFVLLESYVSDKCCSKEMVKRALEDGDLRYDLDGQEALYGAAMNSISAYSSLHVAREFMTMAGGKVLDVGGGIGTYAIDLCKYNDSLTVDIYEQKDMVPVCQDNIRAHNLDHRIKCYANNIVEDDLLDKYDGAVLSKVLHLFDQDTIIRILRKVADGINDNGLLILHDLFLSPNKTEPTMPSLLTYDWMLMGAYFNASVDDVRGWVEPLGLSIVKHVTPDELNMYSSIVVVRKNAGPAEATR